MIGIVVQLAISWLLVWLYEKGDLRCLGLKPTKKRLSSFTLFFFITAACAISGFLLNMLIAKQNWELNPHINFQIILKGFWFTLKSVLFEELIFRGVLLYILIRKIGATKSIIISSVTFGIYHWFSHELWGNPFQMVIEFLTSGTMGLLLAYGYSKTFSLYVPVAIHLAWNLVHMIVFSGNTIGDQFFVEIKPSPVVTISYFSYYFMILFPILSCWLINFGLLRNYKQVQL